MSWFHQTRIETSDRAAQSLCWQGDELVDWVGGGDRWTLDGSYRSAQLDPGAHVSRWGARPRSM